jgi:hypothetical protein
MSWVQTLVAIAVCGLAADAAKPNILWVLTDDQDIELGGLTPMSKTRELIGDHVCCVFVHTRLPCNTV